MLHITRRQDATSNANTFPLHPGPQSYNNNAQKQRDAQCHQCVGVWQSESERASGERASEQAESKHIIITTNSETTTKQTHHAPHRRRRLRRGGEEGASRRFFSSHSNDAASGWRGSVRDPCPALPPCHRGGVPSLALACLFFLRSRTLVHRHRVVSGAVSGDTREK